jgi:hypothetical protein
MEAHGLELHVPLLMKSTGSMAIGPKEPMQRLKQPDPEDGVDLASPASATELRAIAKSDRQLAP